MGGWCSQESLSSFSYRFVLFELLVPFVSLAVEPCCVTSFVHSFDIR